MTDEEARDILDRINALRSATTRLHLLMVELQQLRAEVAARDELAESPRMVLH